LGYNAVARLAGADCARFVAAAGWAARPRLAAPDIYAADQSTAFSFWKIWAMPLFDQSAGKRRR